ncbi:hypothetical protein JCM3765_006849 [Sporobolomyces pararoseus]
MSGQQHVSLEPLPIFANDGKDSDLFAKPPRLQDVNLEDGSEVYTRNDPEKSLQERLMKVWAERGDYSLVTAESIKNAQPEDADKDKMEQDPQGRPFPEEMRKFAETMLNNLTVARGELSTALDLLNVLSPATDPPNVDINTIPLPHETLTLVPTSVPPPPSFSDPSQNPIAGLPLAESLETLKLNAKLFFNASEDLIPLDDGADGNENEEPVSQPLAEAIPTTTSSSAAPTRRRRTLTKSPDPWPTIFHLHSSVPSRSLIPLGALPGATLTGKNETRSARQVGVFYGFEEAGRDFRRASVAGIREVVSPDVERGGGRKLCLELCEVGGEGRIEREVWDDRRDEAERQSDATAEHDDGVDGILKRRNRSAFAEELFANLIKEAKDDVNLGAQYSMGNLTRSDSIEMKSIGGWQLKLSMISPTSKLSSTSQTPKNTPISLLSPLLRLLFLHEYSSRRQRPDQRSTASKTRPLLATLSTFLQYVDRIDTLKSILRRVESNVTTNETQNGNKQQGKQVHVETGLWSGERKLNLNRKNVSFDEEESVATVKELSEDVLSIIRGEENQLGGRALIRLNQKFTFHILFSLPLPNTPSSTEPSFPSSSLNSNSSNRQPLLTLRSPGKTQPVVIPSMRHLEDFLASEVNRVLGR